jgi:hypothetical protein
MKIKVFLNGKLLELDYEQWIRGLEHYCPLPEEKQKQPEPLTKPSYGWKAT